MSEFYANLGRHLFEGALVTVLGVFAYLLKYYFTTIHRDISDIKSSLDKSQGRFESISESMHRATTELAITRQEVKALWRTVDGFPRRVSDSYNGSDDES